jgi:GEVED domain
MTNFLTCYCTPSSTDCTWDDVISRVQLNTLNNPSTCGTNGYTNYSSTIAAPLLARGSNNTLSVTVGNGGDEYVGAWIDWNQNGIFETTEFTYIGMGTSTIVGGTVSVPVTAKLGNTMMRVRVRYNVTLTGADVCATYTYGETEDYLVRIVPQTPSGVNSTQCGTITPNVSVSSNTGATTPVFAWYCTFWSNR